MWDDIPKQPNHRATSEIIADFYAAGKAARKERREQREKGLPVTSNPREDGDTFLEEYYAAKEAWRNRKFSFADLKDGAWLIKAGQIEPHTGFFWHAKREMTGDVIAALDKTYGKGAFTVRNHGSTTYIWRNHAAIREKGQDDD